MVSGNRLPVTEGLTEVGVSPEQLADTTPGMAHFAHTGPEGTRCGDCAHWTATKGKFQSGARKGACAMHRKLGGKSRSPVPDSAPSCKFFAETELSRSFKQRQAAQRAAAEAQHEDDERNPPESWPDWAKGQVMDEETIGESLEWEAGCQWSEAELRPIPCAGCGRELNWRLVPQGEPPPVCAPMLHDALWRTLAVAGELLCLACMEIRMFARHGRPVTFEELKPCPFNYDNPLFLRLAPEAVKRWVKPFERGERLPQEVV